jgi:hypothetical protein
MGVLVGGTIGLGVLVGTTIGVVLTAWEPPKIPSKSFPERIKNAPSSKTTARTINVPVELLLPLRFADFLDGDMV